MILIVILVLTLIVILLRLFCFTKFIKITTNTPVFYINLDSNTKRNTNIVNLTKRLGFNNVNRFSAINTKAIENVNLYKDKIDKDAYQVLINSNKIRRHHYELSNGAIGCYLSHLEIIKRIVKERIKYAIIMEDDLYIHDNNDEFWNKINNIYFPKDADIFLLEAKVSKHKFKTYIGTRPVNFFLGTTFYVITYNGAKTILEALVPIKYQIDSAISQLACKNIIKIYYNNIIKAIQQQNIFKTDIQVPCKNCNMVKDIKELCQNYLI